WSYSTWKATKDTRRPTSSQYHQRATPVVGKAPLRENQPTNTQRSSKVPIC
ncbi:hypothetical protein FQN60_005989, partial [Etheostoma spectabile]